MNTTRSLDFIHPTPGGNFEGRNIPDLIAKPVAAWMKELKTTPAALQTRVSRMRAKLLATREKRIRPGLDDKVPAG
jgi:hypothetical protein